MPTAPLIVERDAGRHSTRLKGQVLGVLAMLGCASAWLRAPPVPRPRRAFDPGRRPASGASVSDGLTHSIGDTDMLQIAIENLGFVLLGAAYMAAPLAALAGLNEVAIRLLVRRC